MLLLIAFAGVSAESFEIFTDFFGGLTGVFLEFVGGTSGFFPRTAPLLAPDKRDEQECDENGLHRYGRSTFLAYSTGGWGSDLVAWGFFAA